MKISQIYVLSYTVESMVSCTTCGNYNLNGQEWFCSVCGKERADCPDCGSQMGDETCTNCDTARKAPCEECDTLIKITDKKCSHCGYNPGAEYEKKSESNDSTSLLPGKIAISVVAAFAVLGTLFVSSGGAGSTLLGGLIFIALFVGTSLYWVLKLVGFIGGKTASTVRKAQAATAKPSSVEKGISASISEDYISKWKNRKQNAHQRTRIQCPDCSWSTETIVYGNITEIQTERKEDLDTDSSLRSVTAAAADLTDDLASDKTLDCNVCDSKINIYTDWDGVPSHIKSYV